MILRTIADLAYFTWHAAAVAWVTSVITLRYLLVYARVKLLRRDLDLDSWRRTNVAVARRFVASAVRLKGGLIKVGQFLSARADVMPKESIEILAKLQDQVDPADFRHVWATITAELGTRAPELGQVEPACLAAASFGQVHRSVLPDGRAVVVKVQHRRIERSLRIDLRILRLGFGLFDWLMPRLGLLRVFREIRRATRSELDYRQEATNCRRVAAIFADDERVVIPAVINELSTRRVLVLEYLDGIKVNDTVALEAAGIDQHALMELVIEAYSRQIYIAGFFQADPHPGNLFAMPGPRLGIVDFGMCKQIPDQLLKALRRGVYAILSRDMDELLASLVSMGLLGPDDGPKVQPYLTKIAERIQVGSMEEFRDLQHEMATQARQTFREIRELLRSLDKPRVPEDLVLYGRTISLLQGLVAQVAPDLEVFGTMMPFMLRFLGGGAEQLERHRPLRSERRRGRALDA